MDILFYSYIYKPISLSVNINIWGDYDTGGFGGGCGTAGIPDGPYFLFNNIVLPINLNYFKGDCNILEWETENELNNSHFNIRGSYDGENWVSVVNINSKGNTITSTYYFWEVSTTYLYYQLRQYDFNGSYKDFNVVVLNCWDNKIPILEVYDLRGQLLGKELPSTEGIYLIRYEDNSIRKIHIPKNL